MAEKNSEYCNSQSILSEHVYSIPVKTSNEIENEYHLLNKQSQQPPRNEFHMKNMAGTTNTYVSVKDTGSSTPIKTKNCDRCIFGFFLFLLFLLASGALTIGILSWHQAGFRIDTPSNQQDTSISEILTEMNAKVTQLIEEVKRNNTVLMNSIIDQILNMSNLEEILALKENVQYQLSQLNESHTNVIGEVMTLWAQLNATNERRLHQNCYQEVRSCEITLRATAGSKHLYCDTARLMVNTTVSDSNKVWLTSF